MVFSSLLDFLRKSNVQVNIIRFGHQMSTRNSCHGPIPKYRGIKRNVNEKVHGGEILVTQRLLRIHPGMNVGLTWNKNLTALCAGRVKFTSELFDPNFDNPLTMAQYGHRKGQVIWKKYIHVIPDKEHNRFKLVDVV